jgi:hypothetical protein
MQASAADYALTYFTTPKRQLVIWKVVRVTLRLAIYRQSVRLGAKSLEACDQIFLFFN